MPHLSLKFKKLIFSHSAYQYISGFSLISVPAFFWWAEQGKAVPVTCTHVRVYCSRNNSTSFTGWWRWRKPECSPLWQQVTLTPCVVNTQDLCQMFWMVGRGSNAPNCVTWFICHVFKAFKELITGWLKGQNGLCCIYNVFLWNNAQPNDPWQSDDSSKRHYLPRRQKPSGKR